MRRKRLWKDYERGEKDYGTSKFKKNGKGIKCHECEGFGQVSFPTDAEVANNDTDEDYVPTNVQADYVPAKYPFQLMQK